MAIRVLTVLAFYLVHWSFQVEACQVDVEKVGCFADRTRPLKQLLVYRRNSLEDEALSVSLPRLLCDCAVLAKSRGYTYIGLQYYAECWSSKKALPDYGRDGPSENCKNKVYDKCADEDTECVGGALANYVYKIKEKSIADSTTTPGNEQTQLQNMQLVNTMVITSPSTSATTSSSTTTTSPSTSATTSPSTSATTSPSTSATTLPSTTTTTLPSTSATTSSSTTTTPLTTPEPPTTTQATPCYDKNPKCPLNSVYCSYQYPVMLEQCPKTCGLCK